MDFLRTELVTTGGVSTLFVAGEVDIAARGQFAAILTEAVDASLTSLLIDLSEIEFMDSSGLHCLIDACRRCYERGIGFRVSRLSDRAARVFEIAGIRDTLCGPTWARADNPDTPERGTPAVPRS